MSHAPCLFADRSQRLHAGASWCLVDTCLLLPWNYSGARAILIGLFFFQTPHNWHRTEETFSICTVQQNLHNEKVHNERIIEKKNMLNKTRTIAHEHWVWSESVLSVFDSSHLSPKNKVWDHFNCVVVVIVVIVTDGDNRFAQKKDDVV